MFVAKCEGANKAARVKDLWAKIQQFYTSCGVEASKRMFGFGLSSFKQRKKSPKLRCSAAACKAWVPFAHQCAQDLLSPDDLQEQAARAAAYHLDQCYMALSNDSVFARDVLKEHSIKFAAQVVALEAVHADEATPQWKVKPKLHLFLELCSDGSEPAKIWNYRDEDWGGGIARMSRRRGARTSLTACSGNLLARFRMSTPVPRIVMSLV
jgi:hypothetical protein